MERYAIEFNKIMSPTFDDVIALSCNYVPDVFLEQPWKCLSHGITPITMEYQLYCYMKAYGAMHQAKLDYSFKFLPAQFIDGKEIDIVDYGCGQCIGVMCYSDYLKSIGKKQGVHSITLIEPSKIALDRAVLHARGFFPEAKIIAINKCLNDLQCEDISDYSDIHKLHIFSNVLDISDIDIDKVSLLIKKSFIGYNQFVSVGSSRGGDSYSDVRITEFTHLFNSLNAILKYNYRDFIPGQMGTCACGVFSTHLNEDQSLRA